MNNYVNVPSKSNKQQNFLKNYFLLASKVKKQDPDPHPDPLVRGMDPRIRMHTKMSLIRNTSIHFSDFCALRQRQLWQNTGYYLLTNGNGVGNPGAEADLGLPKCSRLVFVQKISHPDQQAPVHLFKRDSKVLSLIQ